MQQVPNGAIPAQPKKPKHYASGRFRPGRVLARWWWLVAIVILGVTLLAYQLPSWFKMRGPLYQSTVLIEVQPIPGFDSSAPAGASSSVGYSSAHSTGTTPPSTYHSSSPFINTQVAVIQAKLTLELTLELAAEKSDLLNRLGGNETAVIERMQKSLTVRNRYGTDLIEIFYQDEDPQVAQDAANAIYQSYLARRSELGLQIREGVLRDLKMKAEKEKEKISQILDKYAELADRMGVTVDEVNSSKAAEMILSMQKKVRQELQKSEHEHMNLTLKIAKLDNLDDEELIRIASKIPEMEFAEEYTEYVQVLDDFRELEVSGLAPKHPDYKRKENAFKELRKSLLARALNARKSLLLKSKFLDAHIAKLRKSLKSGSKNAASLEYLKAERKRAQSQLNQLEVEQFKLGSTLTHILHEKPALPNSPITKGRRFFSTVFASVSFFGSLFLAMLLIYAAEAVFPRAARD